MSHRTIQGSRKNRGSGSGKCLVQILLLIGCVTSGSHGTSLSLSEEDEVSREETQKVPPPAASLDSLDEAAWW